MRASFRFLEIMDYSVKDAIIRLLTYKAPNFVREGMLEHHLQKYDKTTLTTAIQELIEEKKIVEKIDPREAAGSPVRYLQLASFENIPIRNSIKVGDVEVPRVLSSGGAQFLPEEINEPIEQLASYADQLEGRFAELVKAEQRKYWANVVSIFGVFMAILALVLRGAPQIITDPSLSFMDVVILNLAHILPLAVVLAIFVLVLRLVIR